MGMKKINLVSEAHKVVGEIGKVRDGFRAKKITPEIVDSYIGLFNSSSRAISTAIQAERWNKSKSTRPKLAKKIKTKKA